MWKFNGFCPRHPNSPEGKCDIKRKFVIVEFCSAQSIQHHYPLLFSETTICETVSCSVMRGGYVNVWNLVVEIFLI